VWRLFTGRFWRALGVRRGEGGREGREGNDIIKLVKLINFTVESVD
jgi:hypothetical protein